MTMDSDIRKCADPISTLLHLLWSESFVQPACHSTQGLRLARGYMAIFLPFFFFGCPVRLAESQFPDQGLNPDHSSEHPES